jgi:hypothetical protein
MSMDKKLPITRLSKFFSQSDFDLNIEMGKEYLHGDINMKLVLYRVDRQKTDIDSVYGEVGTDEIKYFPPVEINALIRAEAPKGNQTYKNGLLKYTDPGNLVFSVYIKHLNELKVDIKYGDYIGYPESETKTRFYTVSDPGIVTSDNKHLMFGYKPYYRTITCTYVQDNEFRGV